jgi:hypothetical protein
VRAVGTPRQGAGGLGHGAPSATQGRRPVMPEGAPFYNWARAVGPAVARARGETEGVGAHPQVKTRVCSYGVGIGRLGCSRAVAPDALLAGPRNHSRGPVMLEYRSWMGALRRRSSTATHGR